MCQAFFCGEAGGVLVSGISRWSEMQLADLRDSILPRCCRQVWKAACRWHLQLVGCCQISKLRPQRLNLQSPPGEFTRLACRFGDLHRLGEPLVIRDVAARLNASPHKRFFQPCLPCPMPQVSLASRRTRVWRCRCLGMYRGATRNPIG